MISSTFECFDPITFGLFNNLVWLNWGVLLFFVLLRGIWNKSNIFIRFFFFIQKKLSLTLGDQEVSGVGGSTRFLLCLFFFVFFFNFSGFVPFYFSCSRHIIWTLFLGLPIWLRFVIERFFYNPFSNLSYFLPRGAFLVLSLVEVLSLIIQPLTLSIRLMANLRVGHVIAGLICRLLSFFFCLPFIIFINNFFIFILLFFIIFFFLIFELAVNLVQSYIFFLLICTYGGINISNHQSFKI